MKGIITIILLVVIVGMMGLLCLFSCILASRSDEYWEKIRKEMEERNGKH